MYKTENLKKKNRNQYFTKTAGNPKVSEVSRKTEITKLKIEELDESENLIQKRQSVIYENRSEYRVFQKNGRETKPL